MSTDEATGAATGPEQQAGVVSPVAFKSVFRRHPAGVAVVTLALDDQLVGYFPSQMQERFRPEIEAHRLRRDIIATRLANSLVNRCGPTLASSLHERGGGDPAAITRAYWTVRDSFATDALNAQIEALDNVVPGQLQLELYASVQDVTVDRTGWFLRNTPAGAPLRETIGHYREGLALLATELTSSATGEAATRRAALEARLTGAGVPAELARRLALLPALAEATDVVLIADQSGRPLPQVARAFFSVGERFQFAGVEAMLDRVQPADHYEGVAVQKAREGLAGAHHDLVRALLGSGNGAVDLDTWQGGDGGRGAATAQQVSAILADGNPTSAKGTVAASLLSDLARQAGAA